MQISLIEINRHKIKQALATIFAYHDIVIGSAQGESYVTILLSSPLLSSPLLSSPLLRFDRHRKVRCLLTHLTLGGSLALSSWAAAAVPDPVEYLCQPDVPVRIQDTDQLAGPVYFHRNASTGEIERLVVTSIPAEGKATFSYKYVMQVVRDHEWRNVCNHGYAAAVLPRDAGTSASNHSKAHQTKANLPVFFTIAKFAGEVYIEGNFNVPGTMPVVDDAHLVEFNVYLTNFNTASGGSHLVNMQGVQTTSFLAGFHASGFFFGPARSECANSNAMVGETWNLFVSDPVKVWGSGSGNNTCSPMTLSGSAYHFFAGANRAQQSAFWRSSINGSNEIQSGTINHHAPIPNKTGAGVAFLVATGPTTLPPAEQWTLWFTNAYHWTQP